MRIDPKEFFINELSDGHILCFMPIERVRFDDYFRLSSNVYFFPPKSINWNSLRLVNQPYNLFKISDKKLDNSFLIGGTINIDWDNFLEMNLNAHCKLIESLSNHFESKIDLYRYRLSRLDLPDSLIGRVGYMEKPGFSVAFLYCMQDHESHIIAGRYITNIIVSGVGMELEEDDSDFQIPDNDIGKVIYHALLLYRNTLEASNLTAKFSQAMTILEYLDSPGEYTGARGIKRSVAVHLAKDKESYHKICSRILALLSAESHENKYSKVRTKIVHEGYRIEEIISNNDDIVCIFKEIDQYIRAILDFLINCKLNTWQEVNEWRNNRRKELKV